MKNNPCKQNLLICTNIAAKYPDLNAGVLSRDVSGRMTPRQRIEKCLVGQGWSHGKHQEKAAKRSFENLDRYEQ